MPDRLVIDDDLCEGHGRCYALHPELFDCDDEGRGIVLQSDLSEHLRPQAMKAINACPERAVSIISESGEAHGAP